MKVLDTTQKHLMVCVALVILVVFFLGCKTSPAASQTPAYDLSNLDLTLIPIEQALSNGKPTLAEFGRGICIPCKAMKPILNELAAEYKDNLNVVIVEIDEHQDLTYQYRIMAIPTQIFLDSSGKEITRHIGFLPKEDIITQLKRMGID